MPTPVYIQDQEVFESMVQDLYGLTAFSIDTEFDNNHYSYGFNLCLIQIATPDACFLIDPFEVKDLSSLWGVLENPAIVKVLHDCGEDLRLFYLHGCSPRAIFDTSMAVKLLNFEKIGLGSVLSEVLGVESSKKKQQSNWLKRPLLPLQLDYAANDVIYLLKLRDLFIERLQVENRWEWFQQSMDFLEQKNYAPKPKSTFLSPKEQKEFGPFDQYVLNELYRFRDDQAQRIGKPLYQVISEKIIYDILQQSSVLDDWTNLKGIHYRLQNQFAIEELRQVVVQSHAKAQELALPKQKKRPSSQELAEIQQRTTRYNALRNDVFLPIKRWIELQYGLLITPYIISNETISTLISGEVKLGGIGPEFQQFIIQEAATALEIDISAFR